MEQFFQDEAQKAIAIARTTLSTKEGFSMESNSNGIFLESRPAPPQNGTWRMIGEFPIPAKQMFDLVWDYRNTPKLSPSIEHQELLGTFAQGEVLALYNRHETPAFGVSKRDFVILKTREEKDGQFMICNRSVLVPQLKGEVSGCVRGEYSSAWLIKQHPDNKEHSHVTYYIQTDPKGWIPGFVVTQTQKSLPTTFGNIRTFCTKSVKK